MLSQSGFAKAKLLNMHKAKLLNIHTKALIRPFDKGARRPVGWSAKTHRLARPAAQVHNGPP
jgi:hypothetical protein